MLSALMRPSHPALWQHPAVVPAAGPWHVDPFGAGPSPVAGPGEGAGPGGPWRRGVGDAGRLGIDVGPSTSPADHVALPGHNPAALWSSGGLPAGLFPPWGPVYYPGMGAGPGAALVPWLAPAAATGLPVFQVPSLTAFLMENAAGGAGPSAQPLQVQAPPAAGTYLPSVVGSHIPGGPVPQASSPESGPRCGLGTGRPEVPWDDHRTGPDSEFAGVTVDQQIFGLGRPPTTAWAINFNNVT